MARSEFKFKFRHYTRRKYEKMDSGWGQVTRVQGRKTAVGPDAYSGYWVARTRSILATFWDRTNVVGLCVFFCRHQQASRILKLVLRAIDLILFSSIKCLILSCVFRDYQLFHLIFLLTSAVFFLLGCATGIIVAEESSFRE
jgi:hypothetical protein